MTKFWKMLVAFLAMCTMVIVPTSCGDDDDDNGSSKGNLITGKTFVRVYNGSQYEVFDAYRFNADGTYENFGYSTHSAEAGSWSEKNKYSLDANNSSQFIIYEDAYSEGIDGTPIIAGVDQILWHVMVIDGKTRIYADDHAENYYEESSESNESVKAKYEAGKKKADAMEEEMNKPIQQSKVEEPVVVYASYTASNPSIGITFEFDVVSASGSYMSRNQVVTISIEGEKYVLSDAGDSYLIYENDKFYTANTATSKSKADKIVMCLACANSTADYTITSATINDTMRALGATETKFVHNK